MSENKNTLAKGMFVREHTFNSGTKVLNVSISVADFCSFVKDNMNEDSNGNQWVNLKLIPNKNVGAPAKTPKGKAVKKAIKKAVDNLPF